MSAPNPKRCRAPLATALQNASDGRERSRPHPAAAFSLVELMCAIMILGVGLAGLIQGVTTALKSSKEAELQATAAWLAAGRIETLRADGYLTDGEEEGEGEGSFANFRWRQTLKPAEVAGLHDVTVEIEEAKSGKTIYELRTLLFDPPPTSTFDTTDKTKPQSSSARQRDRRRR